MTTYEMHELEASSFPLGIRLTFRDKDGWFGHQHLVADGPAMIQAFFAPEEPSSVEFPATSWCITEWKQAERRRYKLSSCLCGRYHLKWAQ